MQVDFDFSNQPTHVKILAALQIALQIAALIHIFTSKSFRKGNRLIWFFASFVSFAGPIAYFAIGRARRG